MGKLTLEQAEEIRRLKDGGARDCDLAKQFDVSRYSIFAIKKGLTHNPEATDKYGRPKGNTGLRNINTKLDTDAVFVIRYLYDRGLAKTGYLAQTFHVTKANITRILNRDWWKHVPETIEQGPANLRPEIKGTLEEHFTQMFGEAGKAILSVITDHGLKVEPDVFPVPQGAKRTQLARVGPGEE